MKTSKIIFTSYFSLVALILISLLVMSFMHNDEETSRQHSKSRKSSTIQTDNFNTISVGKNCNISLRQVEQNNRITYTNDTLKNSIVPVFHVTNDTLYITSTKTNFSNWIDINTTEIKALECNSATITIHKFKQDSISILASNAKVRFSNNTNFKTVDLKMSNASTFDGWSYNGSVLKMNIKRSQVNLSSKKKLDLVKGTIASNSKVQLPKVKSIKLEIDDSSEAVMY